MDFCSSINLLGYQQWTLNRPAGRLTQGRFARPPRHGPSHAANGSGVLSRWTGSRPGVSALSAGTRSLLPTRIAHSIIYAEVRAALPEANMRARTAMLTGATPSLEVPAVRKKQPSFTLAQEEKFLQGKWVVTYDASSLFGPGALGAQEIVLTGSKSTGQFSSITGVSVVGFTGYRYYYQFGSWGYYQFLNKKLVRLTITRCQASRILEQRHHRDGRPVDAGPVHR